jgi:hypothetical protein
MIDMDLSDIAAAPRRWLIRAVVAVLWSGACFAAGYLYHAHRAEIAAAKIEAKQEATQAPVTAASEAIDQSAIARRDTAIETTKQRTVYVTRLIEKEAHANPAPVDCRLPDGLRDEINRDLAPDRLEAADPM